MLKTWQTCVPQDAERARPVGTATALEFAAMSIETGRPFAEVGTEWRRYFHF